RDIECRGVERLAHGRPYHATLLRLLMGMHHSPSLWRMSSVGVSSDPSHSGTGTGTDTGWNLINFTPLRPCPCLCPCPTPSPENRSDRAGLLSGAQQPMEMRQLLADRDVERTGGLARRRTAGAVRCVVVRGQRGVAGPRVVSAAVVLEVHRVAKDV